MADQTIYPYGTNGQLPSSIGIINDTTTGGADKALSAEQGKKIGKLLNAKDSDFYNVWVGTAQELEALDGDYQDDTLYIVGAVATIPTKFSVTKTGISEHVNVSGTNAESTQVQEGKPFTLTLSPASGYTIDTATGTMVGGTLTKTNNQDGTVTFSTSAVTGAITITAAATKHITGITVSAGTRSGNSIPLTATVTPAGADNVTLDWSVNDTTNFGISGSGASATLTVKSGASNSSVTITCQDINASSGTASDTLPLTGITYEETPIPIEGITDITATRTAANTLRLDAVTNPADANTPTVSFSLVGTVPTVKQVRRWAAGDTVDGEVKESAGNDLIELPAVELSGNTLTYKGDCQVQVQATADNVEPYTKTVNIVHDNADAIWFEDSAVKSLITSKGIGSGGNITYTQAAAVTTFKINNAHTFKDNKTILRFKEYKFFTSATDVGTGASSPVNFVGCTNLKALSTPKGASLPSQAFCDVSGPLKGLEELEIDSNATSRFISSNSSLNANLKLFTVGNNATALNQALEAFSNLTTVDLGSGISSVPAKLFKSCSSLGTVTLRYDGKITKSDQMFTYVTAGSVDLYVPSSQVENYAGYDSAIKEVHAITE